MTAKKLASPDSFSVSGWTIATGTRLAKGSWRVGALAGDLRPADGAWDGTSESWTARIPSLPLGEGIRTLYFATRASSGDSVLDSVRLEVVGAPRPVLLVSDFDKDFRTTWDSAWYTSVGPIPDSSRMDTSIRTSSDHATPFASLAAHIGQPPAQTYPNYAGLLVSMPTGLVEADPTRNIAGVSLDINTTRSSATQDFVLYAYSTQVTDWNLHFVTLPNTKGKWQTKKFLFDDFAQDPGWGKQVGPLDPKSIYSLEIRARGAGDVVVSFDNFVLLGTRGTALGLHDPSRSHAIPLAARNRTLTVDVVGDWTLLLVGADGRTKGHWSGNGAGEIGLESIHGTTWAILESKGGRDILALPPVH